MDEMTTYPQRVTLFGIDIDPYTMQQTVERAEDLIASRAFAHLIGVNADKVLQIRDSEEMRDIVAKCEIVNADGASMLMAAERLGVDIPERVAGIDLMEELCGLSEAEGHSVFLLGARAEVVEKCRDAIRQSHPNLNVCGTHDGYFDDSQYEDIAKVIDGADPDVVFVGITSPKKERFIEYMRERGNKGVYVGVGGSFDVISGNIPRAPMWMQRAKLEWLFRMLQEPRRLAKRYIVGNTRFVRIVAAESKAKKTVKQEKGA